MWAGNRRDLGTQGRATRGRDILDMDSLKMVLRRDSLQPYPRGPCLRLLVDRRYMPTLLFRYLSYLRYLKVPYLTIPYLRYLSCLGSVYTTARRLSWLAQGRAGCRGLRNTLVGPILTLLYLTLLGLALLDLTLLGLTLLDLTLPYLTLPSDGTCLLLLISLGV